MEENGENSVMEVDSNDSNEKLDLNIVKKEPMETEETTNNVEMNGEKNDEKEQDEEDPIVKEVPVFLSKGLSKNLFLFQVIPIMRKKIFARNLQNQFLRK